MPSLWGPHGDNGDPFRSLHREIDKVFNEFTRGFAVPVHGREERNGGLVLSPRIDVSETDTAVEVTAELPGVSDEELDVSLSDNVLTIKGEKTSEKEETKKDYHLVERSYGAYQRSIRLPCEVDQEKIDAKFDKGVLTIVLPKSPETKAKTQKISVTSAS